MDERGESRRDSIAPYVPRVDDMRILCQPGSNFVK